MEIQCGYQAGLIGSLTELHARFYHREHGFPASFEIRVATDLCEFIQRLDRPRNQIWHVSTDGRIAGTIAIDGEDLGGNQAHLRWFITDDSLRGTGMGRKLLDAAVQYCDDQGFSACVLWTFQGLEAARHLYEKTGFQLVEEWQGDQWGKTVTEQRFVRKGALDLLNR